MADSTFELFTWRIVFNSNGFGAALIENGSFMVLGLW